MCQHARDTAGGAVRQSVKSERISIGMQGSGTGRLTGEERGYAAQVEGEAEALRLAAPPQEAQELWGGGGTMRE
jgi:hypothetical protein